jgi:hypothetical protein
MLFCHDLLCTEEALGCRIEAFPQHSALFCECGFTILLTYACRPGNLSGDLGALSNTNDANTSNDPKPV